MADPLARRKFLETAAVIAAGGVSFAGATSAQAQPAGDRLSEPPREKKRIVAVACSPRKGKTTFQSLGICLQAAKEEAPSAIETELIELADLEIPAALAAGIPLKPGQQDDFPPVAEKLADRSVRAVIVGTPVYFGSPSALCKAFLDRCIALRARGMALANRIGAAVAVGGVRNGGQELALQVVQAALLCQEMLVVGDGRPTAHFGATVWNDGHDDISRDEFGVTTLKNLGRRVAQAVVMLER